MKAFYEQHKTDLADIDDRMLLVADLVAALAPTEILDIACGRGAMLRLMRDRLPGAHLRGLDISESSAAQAREAGFDVAVGDVQTALPYEPAMFDCVVFGEVIEHLVDPDAALVEIARTLRTGGLLVLTTPNLASWFNRILLLLGIQPIFTETSLHTNLGRKTRLLGQWNPTQGHLKIFTLDALKEMLHANGYEIVEIKGAPFPRKTVFAFLDRTMARLPSLASNFVVIARNEGSCRTAYPLSS